MVELNSVGEEIVTLYHDELDQKIVSEDLLQILSNPVLFQTYIYYGKSEWIIELL